ncbi:hypothetical protein [Alkalilimnicola sp. S0819]|uniref:hypothetical protein n=1 Tax=Alkalilimnicola sp. S0819 TaxID=2613922 RepID=UPI0012629C9B|nr:hypothetical protein [Alkalilimnicola sp. S0819]KAB7623930.1 hypothetical protein F3N43_07745 [Alkalilimnicola sp. S0819]MPQ16528.1 hypothetical protein [Alkalilimnicola sp. S0819]
MSKAMEIEHNIFLHRVRLPSASALSDALARHGLALVLPADFDPAAEELELAVQWRAEPVRIMYYANPVDVAELRAEGLLRKGEAGKLADRDFLLSVVSDTEAARPAALALAAVLTELADGCLAYAGEPPFIFAEQAVAWCADRL